jgi:uncharacterized protein YcbK (DUF882 family)
MLINMVGNIQLRKNFNLIEFINKLDGNSVMLPDPKLLDGLQYTRDRIGSMMITSGFRTIRFNKAVGGSPNSYHLKGLAVDFKGSLYRFGKTNLIGIFKKAGFTNVKFYYRKNSRGNYYLHRCHVDVGPTWNGKDFCVLANKYE